MKIFINEIHSKLSSVTWWPFCPGGDDLIEFSRTSNDARAWISNYIHTEGWYVNTYSYPILTHWGRVTHICVSKLTIIGSDNGLSPGRRQAIIWTNAGILLIGSLGTNFNEISIEIHKFSFKKIHLKMSSGKWRPSCLGLNVLNQRKPGHGWIIISIRIYKDIEQIRLLHDLTLNNG